MKTSFKPAFRPSTVKGRAGTVVYRLTHLRITRLITTDYKLYPHEWSDQRSAVKATNRERAPILRAIDQRIRWDLERLNRIIQEFDSSSFGYTTDDVVNEYHRLTDGNMLYNYMEAYIIRLGQLNKVGTAKNYKATLCSLKRFRQGEEIPFESFDARLVEEYQAYLKAEGCTPNSISFYTRILRALYKRAVEEGLTVDRKPFRTAFTGSEKTRKRAISSKDIRRIQDVSLLFQPNLAFARDLFIFLFLCRGMSFIDAAFLKKSDIRNGVLTYRRHKTNQLLYIKVVPKMQAIIDRYSDPDSPYLLPVITRPGEDERRQYTSALRLVNHDLKAIGKMLGIPTLTTYVARHSWATIAKKKRIAVGTISDALGHDSIQTTEIYLASIDTASIDRANDIVIKDLGS